MYKIPEFHLKFWCGNFVGNAEIWVPKSLQKLRVSTKFPHQDVKWDFCSLHYEKAYIITMKNAMQ